LFCQFSKSEKSEKCKLWRNFLEKICGKFYEDNDVIVTSLIAYTYVGFVAAAVSMPMGGCRAIYSALSLPVVVVAVVIAVRLAVL